MTCADALDESTPGIAKDFGERDEIVVGDDPLLAEPLSQLRKRVADVASLDPLIAGFWVVLGSDMKGSSEIDRGFRVWF